MKGLRTQETNEFVKFFEKVQEKANAQNKVFFLDSGDCKDINFQDMTLDDISGWLIPIDKSDEFEIDFLNWSLEDKWDDFFMWAIPSVKENLLQIDFLSFA